MSTIFRDRKDAGIQLAQRLQEYAHRQDVLVLALPRGGVPVAFEVAASLEVELDLLLVRKLGLPGQEELAMGAIASGGTRVLNEQVVDYAGVSPEVIEEVTRREQQELERRERLYRGDAPLPQIERRCVIVIDDGLATGSTMRAAVQALHQHKPHRIVVAVPVAPPQTLQMLRQHVDEVVCVNAPAAFGGVGRWYADFQQTTDDAVRDLLLQARQRSGKE